MPIANDPKTWDWAAIRRDVDAEDWEDDDGWSQSRRIYLGTVFAIMPSGKYYMPWTTNQTDEDVEKDADFIEALEEEAAKHGLGVEHGEGDPCDMFLVEYRDKPRSDEDKAERREDEAADAAYERARDRETES